MRFFTDWFWRRGSCSSRRLRRPKGSRRPTRPDARPTRRCPTSTVLIRADPMRRWRNHPGRSDAAASGGGLYRRPRERVLAARHSAPARLHLCDRSDRPRRRGWTADYRRPQRAGDPLRAGPQDRRHFQRRSPRHLRPAWRAAADDQCQGRSAAAADHPACGDRTVPVPKASPLAAAKLFARVGAATNASGSHKRRRRSTSAAAQPKPADAQTPPPAARDHRCCPSQARAANRPDAVTCLSCRGWSRASIQSSIPGRGVASSYDVQ